MPSDVMQQLQSISENGTDQELKTLASNFLSTVDKNGEIVKMVQEYGKTIESFTPEVARNVLQNLIPFLKSFGEDVLKKVSEDIKFKMMSTFNDREKFSRFKSIYNDKSILDVSSLTPKAKSEYLGMAFKASSSSGNENILRSLSEQFKKESEDMSDSIKSMASQFNKIVETQMKDIGKRIGDKVEASLEPLSHFADYDTEFKKRYKKYENKEIPSGWLGGEIAYRRKKAAAELEEDFRHESKRDIEIANTFEELSERKGLTRTEKNRIEELKKEYRSKEFFDERDKFGEEVSAEAKKFGSIARPISLADRALLVFDSHVDDLNEKFKEFAKGSPVGMNAFMLATAFAVKELVGFIGRMSDTVKSMAELDIQAAQVKTTFDSMFGSRQFDSFRDALALTRREMMEFSRTVIDAYRSSGVEMEKTMAVASNIKNQFGQLDTSKLQEAVSIMSELTDSQVNALMGRGSFADVSNMYASLARSRKAGQAADLLEQGVFGGDPLLESLNDRDKEIVKLQRLAEKHLEDISHLIKDYLPPGMQYAMMVTKYLAGLTPIVSSILMAVSMGRMLNGLRGEGALPIMGGLVSKLGGWGAIGGVAGGLAITAAGTLGLNYLQNRVERKIQDRDELRRQEQNDIYSLTGLASGNYDIGIDEDKIKAVALKYSKWGAGIGGTIGTAVGTFAGGPVGSVAGGAGGTVIGGGYGYALGEEIERNRQKNRFKGNALFEDENGKVDIRILKNIQESNESQKRLVEFAKKEQQDRARSLRSIERTQITLERVSKGMYASDAEANIAMAKRNIEKASITGGTAGGYRMNVFSIMENSVKSFSVNMDVLNNSLLEAATEVGIEEESRLEKTREILTAQADVTQKFIDAMNENIGKYERIPEVIVSALKNRINQINLDFRQRTGGGTSQGNLDLVREQVNEALKGVARSMAEFSEEEGDIQKAFEALKEKRKSLEDAVNKMGEEGLVEGFNRNLNDSGVMKSNQELVAQREKDLNKRILKDYGLDETVAAMMDKAKAPQEGLNKLMNEINSLDEKGFTKAKQEEYKKKVEDVVRSMATAADELSNNQSLQSNEFGKNISDLSGHDAAELFTILETLKQNRNRGITLEQAQQSLSRISSHKEGMNAYGEQLKQSKEDSKYRDEASAINRSKTVLTMAGGLNNDEIAYQKTLLNRIEGLLGEQDKLVNAVGQLVDQFENNPRIKLLQNVADINEKESSWLKLNNQGIEYVSRNLMTIGESIKQRERLAEKLGEELSSIREQQKTSLKDLVSNENIDEGTKQQLKKLGELYSSFSDAKEAFQRTGDEQKLNQVKMLEEQIKASRDANKGNKQFEEYAKILETVSGEFDSKITEFIRNEKEISNLRSREFEEVIRSIHVIDENLTHRMFAQRQSTSAAAIGLFENMNRPDLARAVYGQRLSDVMGKYETDMGNLGRYYDEILEKLKGTGLSQAEMNETARQASLEKRFQIEKEMREGRVAASMDAYNIEKQRLDIIREELDIQSDYMQSIGAPFQEILKVEQRRFGLADENYRNAREHYRRLLQSGERGVAFERAKNELSRAAAEKMKAAYGAQNSALEKMFGNMIGAFGQIAGIIGPNNLAAKYGMGYMQGANGTVFRGNTNGPGLEGRKFAASFGNAFIQSEVTGEDYTVESLTKSISDESRQTNIILDDIRNSVNIIRDGKPGQGNPGTTAISETGKSLQKPKVARKDEDEFRKKNKEFQKIINQIKDPENKNNWQAFWNNLTDYERRQIHEIGKIEEGTGLKLEEGKGVFEHHTKDSDKWRKIVARYQRRQELKHQKEQEQEQIQKEINKNKLDEINSFLNPKELTETEKAELEFKQIGKQMAIDELHLGSEERLAKLQRETDAEAEQRRKAREEQERRNKEKEEKDSKNPFILANRKAEASRLEREKRWTEETQKNVKRNEDFEIQKKEYRDARFGTAEEKEERRLQFEKQKQDYRIQMNSPEYMDKKQLKIRDVWERKERRERPEVFGYEGSKIKQGGSLSSNSTSGNLKVNVPPVEIKPTTITVQFDNELFKKEVVEIVGNEFKRIQV